MYQWQLSNNMLFNEKKFELLRYGKNQELKSTTNYEGPNNNIITEKETVCDLGIIMNSNHTFSDHIKRVCEKSKQKCGWILRTFRTRDTEVLKTLWKSLVQPHIDYCSQLWAPYKSGEIQAIEEIQRQFTAKFLSLSNLNYWERLQTLKLTSQQRRME